jgi:pimeloyl-ACP methyl ester carboxylesterase
VQARNALAMFEFDATALLPTIHIPVLVMVGHRDRVTIPEASIYISEQVPQGQLEKLVPGGHMALLEQHARATRLLGAFAADCLRRPSDHKRVVKRNAK